MATKSIDKKKTLEYAVAFYFYDSGWVISCTSISKPFMTKGQTAEGKTH